MTLNRIEGIRGVKPLQYKKAEGPGELKVIGFDTNRGQTLTDNATSHNTNPQAACCGRISDKWC
jgi:hypothetical protein